MIRDFQVPKESRAQYDEEVLGRSLELIESAGEELIETGFISCGVSDKIGSLVSREKVVEALNSVYARYE